MAEPAFRPYNPAKPKRATNISDAQWTIHKPLIRAMRAGNLTRAQMLQTLETQHGFSPSMSQLDAKLGRWGFSAPGQTQELNAEASNQSSAILVTDELSQAAGSGSPEPVATETTIPATNDVPGSVQLAEHKTLLKVPRAHARSLTEKSMLRQVLNNAVQAVMRDNAQDIEGAIEAYAKACGIIGQVIARSNDAEDKSKLVTIRSTYSSRIAELYSLDKLYDDFLQHKELSTVAEAPESPVLLEDEPSTLPNRRVSTVEPIAPSKHSVLSTRASRASPRHSNNKAEACNDKDLQGRKVDAKIVAAITEAWFEDLILGDSSSLHSKTQLQQALVANLIAFDNGQEVLSKNAVGELDAITTTGSPQFSYPDFRTSWPLVSTLPAYFDVHDPVHAVHLQDEKRARTIPPQASPHIDESHERHKESLDATTDSSLKPPPAVYPVIDLAAAGNTQNFSFGDDIFFPTVRNTKRSSQASSGRSSLRSLLSIAMRHRNSNVNTDSIISISSGRMSISSTWSFHRVTGYDRLSTSRQSIAPSVMSIDG